MNMRGTHLFALLFAVWLGGSPAPSRGADPKGPEVVAYQNCRLLTAAGAPVERGVLIVAKGKILAVGPVESTPIPESATVHDFDGKTLIPGMVDTHSHIGIYPRPHVPAH